MGILKKEIPAYDQRNGGYIQVGHIPAGSLISLVEGEMVLVQMPDGQKIRLVRVSVKSLKGNGPYFTVEREYHRFVPAGELLVNLEEDEEEE